MIPLKDNLRYLVDSTATTVIILLNCIFFVVEESIILSGHAAWVQQYGMFTPSDLTTAFVHANPLLMLLNVLSLFTAMFLHGGIMHLLGNMAFLNCFGRGVEARLGIKRFVLFYLAGGVAADMAHYAISMHSQTPSLGASGAIAAVMSAYLIFFPQARVTGISTSLGLITAPALSFMPIWALTQIASILFEQPHEGGGVAYMAHLGGFAFGLLFAYLLLKRKGQNQTTSVQVTCPSPCSA